MNDESPPDIVLACGTKNLQILISLILEEFFFLICKNVSLEIQSRKTVGWMFHKGLCSTLTNVAFSF